MACASISRASIANTRGASSCCRRPRSSGSGYWLDLAPPQAPAEGAASGLHGRVHPLIGQRLRSPAIRDAVFETSTDRIAKLYAASSRLDAPARVSVGAFVEMALQGAAEIGGAAIATGIEDLRVEDQLVLPTQGERLIQLVIAAAQGTEKSFEIVSSEPGDESTWTRHVSGRLRANAVDGTPRAVVDFAGIEARCPESIDEKHSAGRELVLTSIRRRDGEALASFAPHAPMGSRARRALFDACGQMMLAALPADSRTGGQRPIAFERLEIHGDLAACVRGHAVIRPADEANGDDVVGDVELLDAGGHVVASVAGLRLAKVDSTAVEEDEHDASGDWTYQVIWERTPEADRAAQSVDGPTRNWLVMADRAGVGAALADASSRPGRSRGHRLRGRSIRVDGRGRMDDQAPSPLKISRTCCATCRRDRRRR